MGVAKSPKRVTMATTKPKKNETQHAETEKKIVSTLRKVDTKIVTTLA